MLILSLSLSAAAQREVGSSPAERFFSALPFHLGPGEQGVVYLAIRQVNQTYDLKGVELYSRGALDEAWARDYRGDHVVFPEQVRIRPGSGRTVLTVPPAQGLSVQDAPDLLLFSIRAFCTELPRPSKPLSRSQPLGRQGRILPAGVYGLRPGVGPGDI